MRKEVKRMLVGLEERFPGSGHVMLAALKNVRPTHLLDGGLWRKLGLPVAREDADTNGGEGEALEPAASALREALALQARVPAEADDDELAPESPPV